jgi:uncharacterized protein YjbI with pentapeptide repeats
VINVVKRNPQKRRAFGAHIDLSGADLSGSDLRGVFLHKCNLKRTLLDRANLENADLSGSDLRYTSFRKSKMHQASLRGTALIGARFAGAVTLGCDVFGAKIAGVRNLEFRTLKNISAADSPELQPVILKNHEVSRIFGAETAAVYQQNGVVFLTVGTAATMPLTGWWTGSRADINILSQKSLRAELWEPARRAEWPGIAWDIWLNIKGMLLTAAEKAAENMAESIT